MVATLQKNYSSNSPRDHTEGWSEVVRRGQKGKSKGKGLGGKGMGEKGAGSAQGGRKQPDTQEHPKQHTSTQGADSNQQKAHGQHQFVSLPGKRKVWGTRKVCSSNTVKNTIIKQISPQISINVKRKFKLGSGNKIVKWWHVVSGNEETMALLEQEWDKVKDQTSRNIEPCLSYLDHSKAFENQNPQSGIHAIVRNNALGNAAMHEEADKVSGSSDNADEQGTSQSTIANNQPFLCQ